MERKTMKKIIFLTLFSFGIEAKEIKTISIKTLDNSRLPNTTRMLVVDNGQGAYCTIVTKGNNFAMSCLRKENKND